MTSPAWSERAASRWGHHAPELLITTIVAIVILGLRPVGGTYGLLVSLALVIFVLVSWVMLRRHDRALCEPCLLAMPLNPSQQAEKQRWRFWMAHTGSDPKFVIPYIVVLLGSNFFPGTPGRIAWAVIQLSMIFLIVSYTTHRRLQPWCAWCSEGGGGSRREDPSTPGPLPDDRRQLV